MALGLHEVAKFYYYPGFHEPSSALTLGVNKSLWDELGLDDQNLMATAAAAENVRLYAEFNANNVAALDTLVKEHGVLVRQQDDAVLLALREASAEVMAEIGQSDPMTQRVYDGYHKFRDNAIRWTDLSERAYLNARS